MKLYATSKSYAIPVLAVLALVTFGGCAFVESRTDNQAPGVSYYLPMRPVKLTYIRAVELTKPSKALLEAQKGEQKAEADATAAAQDVASLTTVLANTPAGPALALAQAKLDAAKAVLKGALDDLVAQRQHQ